MLASICFCLKDNSLVKDGAALLPEQYWVNLNSTIKGFLRHLPNDSEFSSLKKEGPEGQNLKENLNLVQMAIEANPMFDKSLLPLIRNFLF